VIHPQAVIHPDARLAADVSVGPFAVIDAGVEIGAGSRIGSHVVINGPTTIGRHNVIRPFAAIGGDPQDKKYRGEPTRLEIGDGNTIHEYVTISRGTLQDAGVTRVGDDNWIMAYVHIAHDCQVGSHTIFANNASLAGHVTVGDHAILGGFTGVHQFCRVGAHVITGISSVVRQDVPPFVTASGNPAAPHGINSEGLKRRGFDADAIAAVKRAYKTLYKSGLGLTEAQAAIAQEAENTPELALLAEFLAQPGRGIVR
jgi:UDP-N-acetylglucosamine acyltransferase